MRFLGISRWQIVPVACILLFSYISLLPVETRAGSSWVVEVVDDTSKWSGFPSSIRMDSNDVPHVAYTEQIDRELRYAYRDGSTWNIQFVAKPAWGVSLALDSSDRPHITYTRPTTDTVMYAFWDGISWDIQEIAYRGHVGWGLSIDADSNDRPHIAYYDYAVNDLKYACKNGTGWDIETVDVGGKIGSEHSLVLDSLDRVHISYYDSTTSNIKYARQTGTGWSLQFVTVANEAQYWSSLALDSMDMPHISYEDRPGESLRFASLSPPMWTTEVVKTDVTTTHDHSLAIDSNDTPHIVYDQTSRLLYFVKVNSTWSEQTIESGFPSGYNAPSISVDSKGRPHVSFSSDGIGSDHDSPLRYARTVPTLPNLTLSQEDTSFSPEPPIPKNTIVTIEATVHNGGPADAWDVYVRFYDGPHPSGIILGPSVYVPHIPPWGVANVSVDWMATPAGLHDICVCADPDDFIAELDELDNVACRDLEVFTPSAPGPPGNISANLGGDDFQDVVLTWGLSADDGAGIANVVRYDVHRGEFFDSNRVGYYLLQSVPNGTSVFTDSLAGEGDPDNHFYFVCSYTAAGMSSCSLNQAGKFTRPLMRGPNPVSVPLIQSDEAVETVLQTVKYDMAWRYGPSSREWEWHMTFKPYRRGLWSIDHVMGLWVNATDECNLTVAGVVSAQTTIHLYEGWNLVSFASFNTSYTVYDLTVDTGAVRVEGYDPAPPYHLRVLGDTEMLQAGYGYWVRVDSDTVWIVGVD